MLIGNFSPYRPPYDFGAAFARTALIAARPTFELQFFRTQDAILDQLDKDIENINKAVNTRGATALLRVQIKRLQNDSVTIGDYKTRTDAKAARVTLTLANFAELITLADPSTIAEFDAKLVETISLMETTKTPFYERYGVQDRLRAAKIDGLVQLQALVHNNFATQGDIDAVTATLTDIQSDYTASQTILNSNVEIAYSLQKNARTTITELSRQAANIRTDALSDATGRVKERQAYYAQVLTMISLSFEASQAFATFIAEAVAIPQKIEPGSVLNLFT